MLICAFLSSKSCESYLRTFIVFAIFGYRSDFCGKGGGLSSPLSWTILQLSWEGLSRTPRRQDGVTIIANAHSHTQCSDWWQLGKYNTSCNSLIVGCVSARFESQRPAWSSLSAVSWVIVKAISRNWKLYLSSIFQTYFCISEAYFCNSHLVFSS